MLPAFEVFDLISLSCFRFCFHVSIPQRYCCTHSLYAMCSLGFTNEVNMCMISSRYLFERASASRYVR